MAKAYRTRIELMNTTNKKYTIDDVAKELGISKTCLLYTSFGIIIIIKDIWR